LELLQLIEFVREDCPCFGIGAGQPSALRKRQLALLREGPYEVNVISVGLVCFGFCPTPASEQVDLVRAVTRTSDILFVPVTATVAPRKHGALDCK
jgi:hypothetical protein